MIKSCLIQFAKAPVLGKVKTRLSSALDEEQRNDLHCAMTAWTCEQLSQVPNTTLELWVDGDCSLAFFQHLAQQHCCKLKEQQGVDLGARMNTACQQALQQYQQVVITGSDCPFITPDTVEYAIKGLTEHDFVFVPADDGGYVLLAMRVYESSVFENIAWGSDSVLEASLSQIKKKQLQYSLLPSLPDIDRPQDLSLLTNPSLPSSIQAFCR